MRMPPRQFVGLAAILMSASGAFGSPGQAQAAPADVTSASRFESAAGGDPEGERSGFTEDDELILEIRTREFVLSEGILAYHRNGRVYVPLGDMARTLDLAISVDGDAGQAAGWFLKEDRKFRLDVQGAVVVSGGRTLSLAARDTVIHQGEIYVDATLLGQWFPLDLEVDTANLIARLKTREPFPFESRAARRRIAARMGLGRDGQINREREPTPYRLFTPPSFDLAARAAYGSEQTDPFEYHLRASGDLLFMNSSLFLRGSRADAVSDVRLVLERKDPYAGLPLGATHIAVGDTYSSGLPMGLRSEPGRGVFVGNAPLGSSSVFSKIDVRGDIGLGHEVELFRNDVLIATERESDGLYHFTDVPLVFGRNDLRLVFHGPRGERREEMRTVQIGDGRLPAGELRFSASAVQRRRELVDARSQSLAHRSDDYGWLAALHGEYGLNNRVTLGLGAGAVVRDGEVRGLALAGVRTGIAGVALAADGSVASGGGVAAQLGIAGAVFGASYALNHAEYAGGFVDENRRDPEGLYRRATELRLDRAFAYKQPGSDATGVLSASLVAAFDERTDGRRGTNALFRTGTAFGPLLLAHTFDYAAEDGPALSRSRLFGALEASGVVRGTGLRARLEYDPMSDGRVQAIALAVDRRIGESMRARVGVSHAFAADGGTALDFAVSREFRTFDLALDGRYDTTTGVTLGLRFSTSLGWSPTTRSWFQAPPGLARSGILEAVVFRDRNGDGVRQPDEALVADAMVSSGGRSASTNRDGVARLTGLGEAKPATIGMSGGLLDDPFAAPARAPFEVTPRPGRVHVAALPIVVTGEVEGRAHMVTKAGARGLAGLTLRLVDSDGKQSGSTRTEYDGFYVFERVRPGRYRLEIDPDDARRLAVKSAPVEVTIGPGGGLTAGLDLTVTSAAPA